MRLLTMLLASVLLAGCVHDTDDLTFFVAEKGASLTYYIGGEKNDDDPWTRITQLFLATGYFGAKTDYDDPWDRICDLFPIDSAHTGKTINRSYRGVGKSGAVFFAFGGRSPAASRAWVTEVRGRVLSLRFADGVEQFVVDAPASWTEGTELETEFVEAADKEGWPFLGVRIWRTLPVPVRILTANTNPVEHDK